MSLFREEPKDRSVQTGLASVFAVVVLVATVNFYRFFSLFPSVGIPHALTATRL